MTLHHVEALRLPQLCDDSILDPLSVERLLGENELHDQTAPAFYTKHRQPRPAAGGSTQSVCSKLNTLTSLLHD